MYLSEDPLTNFKELKSCALLPLVPGPPWTVAKGSRNRYEPPRESKNQLFFLFANIAA